MSRTLTQVAAGAAVTLIAALAVPGSAAAADGAGFCAGMAVPADPGTGVEPVAGDDTAAAIAGGTVSIPVLANDTAAHPLAVVSTTVPAHGDVCVDADGKLEYFAQSSGLAYTDSFTYFVTDGHYLKRATVTLSVEGVLPVRARVLRKLTARHKARLRFTNPNGRAVQILAGDPHKNRPDVVRDVAGGATTKIRTKRAKLFYVVLVTQADGQQIAVNAATVNTKTGHQSPARTARAAQALLRQWGIG